LDEFYKRRTDKLSKLKLKTVLKRKNPYLYRALGYGTAPEIVGEILNAFITSSDEGIFGDAFFEQVAVAVSGGTKSLTDSVDLEIHADSGIKAFAVKSGTAVFNSQSKARQNQAFEECRRRLSKLRTHFEAVVGYAYGSKNPGMTKYTFREVAGQAFWEELTGDPEFYLKLINLMGTKPQEHRQQFDEIYNAALNRFVRDFIADFCLEDGRIDWVKLVRFNSAKKA
jgi:hypothetical protein